MTDERPGFSAGHVHPGEPRTYPRRRRPDKGLLTPKPVPDDTSSTLRPHPFRVRGGPDGLDRRGVVGAASGMSDHQEAAPDDGSAGTTPLDRLGVLAVQTVSVDEHLDHVELYTTEGLLTLLWHGPTSPDATTPRRRVVVCVGGAMGGLLGPDGGLYHQLGRALVAEHDIGLIRVGYRRPNHLPTCVHDTLAAMELASRRGADRFVTLGHSFGGAVAIQAAAHLEPVTVPGVVTFATQSAGCEPVELLADRQLLLFHGTADTILPHHSSELVRMLAGAGELVLLPGADHLLHPAGPEVLSRLLDHLPRVLGGGGPTPPPGSPPER